VGLRIAVNGGGCSGYQYSVKLESSIAEDDQCHLVDGVKIIVDPASAPLLDGLTVDYFDSLTSSGFKFDNPNAKASCGCGTSFSV
jgi:iron-sulfur cluster assembly protein